MFIIQDTLSVVLLPTLMTGSTGIGTFIRTSFNVSKDVIDVKDICIKV